MFNEDGALSLKYIVLVLGLLWAAAGVRAGNPTPPTHADANPSGIYSQGEIIDESRLATMRGGFMIAGMEVHFGATMKTVVDATRLTTAINFTSAGAQVISQTVSSATGAPITPVGSGEIGDIVPANVKIPGLTKFTGVAINDSKGFTAALHNITENAIISSVISNASGRDIKQRIDISVHIANMTELRAAKMRSSIVKSLPSY